MNFPVDDGDGGVAEEGFMDAEETVHDGWSSHELPERVRVELYGKIPKETRQAVRKAHCGFGTSFERYFCDDAAIGWRDSNGYGVREIMGLPSARVLRRAGEALGSLGASPTIWLQQDRVS